MITTPSGATLFWITRVTASDSDDPSFPWFDVLVMRYAPTGWADTQYRVAVLGRN